ncbi:alkyl hydroperoxide reductase AhpD (plasmid) [Mameliella alba]|uniref:carboxymuconolactone decarboxylase family protein n=1 Tax=Mameliella TaxID=1434019 RepID=UPI0013E45FBD|nr:MULTISPECIES: carboxymuconolactone decarboxylase family protein [Mameliella]MDD9732041.1 carboxymuconolactone decarboxylase family protein [Mameliella sp. AT18]BBU59473.1 alkyl hydroperoxide reductase AhpD [Mameliella alba]
MQPRMNIQKLTPDLFKPVLALDGAVKASGLDTELLHLVKIRASQINGCAYCVDMHVKESLTDGMNAQKLHLVATWRESPFFNSRERAALEWTESVTLIADTGAQDTSYEVVRVEFSEAEIARLTVAIGTINLLNRIAVSSRTQHPVQQRKSSAA